MEVEVEVEVGWRWGWGWRTYRVRWLRRMDGMRPPSIQCSRNTDLRRTALAGAAEDGGLLLLTRGISMFGVERVF